MDNTWTTDHFHVNAVFKCSSSNSQIKYKFKILQVYFMLYGKRLRSISQKAIREKGGGKHVQTEDGWSERNGDNSAEVIHVGDWLMTFGKETINTVD